MKVIDPICGMGVDVGAAAESRTRDGTEYHFCSSGCATRFDATVESASPAAAVDREEEARQREYGTLMRKFWVSAVVSVPVVLLSYPWLLPGLKDVSWLARGSDGLLWCGGGSAC